MQFRHLKLRNWRNFVNVDIDIGQRLFLTGPNASGKSNLLDVFRFLHDIAKTGGGLQQAVKERGGLSRIRCLAARRYPDVEIEVGLEDESETPTVRWRYGIGLRQESRGQRRVLLSYERVWKNDQMLLDRPADNEGDLRDEVRLTQTHLEQINSNVAFRAIAGAFEKVLYLHLVPQLLKHPELANRDAAGEDPFGIRFLERVMMTPEKTRRARLSKIEQALRIAVPELKNLSDIRTAISHQAILELNRLHLSSAANGTSHDMHAIWVPFARGAPSYEPPSSISSQSSFWDFRNPTKSSSAFFSSCVSFAMESDLAA